MKLLALSLLLVAMMALALALGTEASPEAEAAPVTEAAVQHDEEDAGSDVGEEAEPEDDDEGDEEVESTEEEERDVVKRALCRRPYGWTKIRRTYYRFFAASRTWAEAQRHCKGMRGNLASVHNRYMDGRLQRLARKKTSWIGFSDAQQESYWFWIDGSAYRYRKGWCRTEPNNLRSREHCAAINWTGRKCWNDLNCSTRLPYICARRRR